MRTKAYTKKDVLIGLMSSPNRCVRQKMVCRLCPFKIDPWYTHKKDKNGHFNRTSICSLRKQSFEQKKPLKKVFEDHLKLEKIIEILT